MVNLLDQSIWTNGNQLFNSSSKHSKTKSPFETIRETNEPAESDILKIAIDLRYASNFQSFWNEEEEDN